MHEKYKGYFNCKLNEKLLTVETLLKRFLLVFFIQTTLNVIFFFENG